jgi:RNA polymerase subunit RPABC4/transcription elongation factor Spt4
MTPDAKSPPAPLEPVRAPISLGLNLPEFPALVAQLGLPSPSPLSPLPELTAPGAHGQSRPIDEILADVRAADEEALRRALTPLAIPDRVIDLRGALFNAAPSLSRLYATRRETDLFAALRRHPQFDRELLFPFTTDDLEVWLQLQFQFSAGQDLAVGPMELTGASLAFVVLLVDAFKAVALGDLGRRAEATPITVTLEDVARAQADADNIRDRRWLASALGEMLALMIHPEGRAEVRLPFLDEAALREEAGRFLERGQLETVDGRPDAYRLGPALARLAADLMTWIQLITLHDVQVVGMTGDTPEAQEDLLAFVVSSHAIWTIASEGLTNCQGDLSGAHFGLASYDMLTSLEVARAFLAPRADVTLPEAFYGGGGPDVAESAGREPQAESPISCPRCGRLAEIDSRFCPSCGAPLQASETPLCRNPDCRRPLREGVRFCPLCGTPVTA